MAVWDSRPDGTFPPIEVATQLSAAGLYRPPLLKNGAVGQGLPMHCQPPQTTISLPVQTAVGSIRAAGTLAPVEVAVQVSVAGSYFPPSLKLTGSPPQGEPGQ
jgi:hypothetical protein